MSRRCIFLAALLQFASFARAHNELALPGGPTLVARWNQAALEAVRRSKIGPPMVARALSVIHTCIYDAWAAYDDRALGTRLGGQLRRPAAERISSNSEKAISFAAYRCAADLFPAEKGPVFDPLMGELGLDTNDTSVNPATPQGVGNLAAAAELIFCHVDGANQLGNLSPSGLPYADYTGYQPVNPPTTLPADVANVVDVNRWVPLQYFDAAGVFVTPSFLAPFWNQVKPFALSSAGQYRPMLSTFGPARYGEHEFLQQAREIVHVSAELNDERKMIAEYWADGPRSETPPGHWNLFAQYVSARDAHSLADDVKLFFALNGSLLDAAIVAWDAKVAWDSGRPVTVIPYLFQGTEIRAWGGPGKGTVAMDGRNWLPYQASTFPTPPFAEFISGHSTFSAAAAEILRLFTGKDKFGASVTFAPGTSKYEPGFTPEKSVKLQWPTFSGAADEAGMSRRYGGIHFRAADLAGRAAGHALALEAWAKARLLWTGTYAVAP